MMWVKQQMKTNKGDRTGVSNNMVKRGIDFQIIACDHLFSIQFLILLAFYITLHACITKYKTHYKTTILNCAVSLQ